MPRSRKVPTTVLTGVALISGAHASRCSAQCTATELSHVGSSICAVTILPGSRAAICVGETLELIDISNPASGMPSLATLNLGYVPTRLDADPTYNMLSVLNNTYDVSGNRAGSSAALYTTGSNAFTAYGTISSSNVGWMNQVLPWHSQYVHIASDNGYFLYHVNGREPIQVGSTPGFANVLQPSLSVAVGVGTAYVGTGNSNPLGEGFVGEISLATVSSPTLTSLAYSNGYESVDTIAYNSPYVYGGTTDYVSVYQAGSSSVTRLGDAYDYNDYGNVVVNGSTAFRVSLGGFDAFSFASSSSPSIDNASSWQAESIAATTSPNNLYVGTSDGTLRCYSIASPTSFSFVNAIARAPGAPGPIATNTSGTRAYVVNGSNNLTVLDITSPSALNTLSSNYATGYFPTSIAGLGTSTAVIGGVLDAGVTLVNCSNAASPQTYSQINPPDGCQVSAVATAGSIVYIVTGCTLYAYDASNPAVPVLKGQLSIPGASGLSVPLAGGAQFAFVGGNVLTAVNVSNPAAMFVAGTLSLPPYRAFTGAIAYGVPYSYAICRANIGDSAFELETISTSDLTHMSQITETLVGYEGTGIAEYASQLYVFGSGSSAGQGFMRFDLSVPTSPYLLELNPTVGAVTGAVTLGSLLLASESNLGVHAFGLTSNFAPYWSSQPVNTTVCHGGSFSLSGAVQGRGTSPGYQWFHNGTAIAGATGYSYSHSGSTLATAGTYFCRYTNSCGSADSATVNVNVCVADFNCSGTVTVQDIFDFLAAWFAHNISADVNDSGSVTIQDIFDFLTAWFAGCS